MMFLSHGTQISIRFPQGSAQDFGCDAGKYFIIANIGAVVAQSSLGTCRNGRPTEGDARSFGLSLLLIPLWAFGEGLALIVVASFLMQAGVQGAGGDPGHLNDCRPTLRAG